MWCVIPVFLLFFFVPIALYSQEIVSAAGDIYFVSSWVPRGSEFAPSSDGGLRLYRWTTGGITIERTLTLKPTDTFESLEVSADGKLAAYSTIKRIERPGPTSSGVCICPYDEYYAGELIGAQSPAPDRAIVLSRSGRYAALYKPGLPPQHFDIASGVVTPAPGGFLAATRQSITSDGRLLLAFSGETSTRLVLWSPSSQTDVTTIPTGKWTEIAQNAVISPNGRMIVSANYPDKSLRAIDVASGRETVLFRPEWGVSSFKMDDQGSLVLIHTLVRDNEYYLAPTDGSSPPRLVAPPYELWEATLQGDGESIYARTFSRMVRISTADLKVIDVLMAPPVLVNAPRNLAQGSYARLIGYNLSDKVRFGDAPLLTLSFTRTPEGLDDLRVQVPWEAPARSSYGYLHFDTGTALEAPSTAFIVDVSPAPIRYLDTDLRRDLLYEAVVAHGDYSSLVTNSNPARPGELLHFYMTGLGLVTPEVATGAPSPANPPAVTRSPVIIRTQADEILTVEFAGLAPGMTGIYLVSARLPSVLSSPYYYPPDAAGVTHVYFDITVAGRRGGSASLPVAVR